MIGLSHHSPPFRKPPLRSLTAGFPESGSDLGFPPTANALESKNGIFKPFGRSAKFFSNLQRCQSLFAGIALYENFEIKTRGVNKGTSTMQWAEINPDGFGSTDFFPQ